LDRQSSGRIGMYLLLAALLIVGYLFLNQQVNTRSDYSYEQMVADLKEGKITDAQILPNREVPTGAVIVTVSGQGQQRFYVTDVTKAEELLRENKISIDVEDVPRDTGFLASLLPMLVSTGLIIFLFVMMSRQMAGGGGNNSRMMNFGKSRARMSSPEEQKVPFKNVAGLKEEKEDLQEVVDFLKAPQKYTRV